MKKILSFLLAACFSAVQAATITSIQSGPWADADTWDCTCVPNAADDVIVAAGHNVSITGTVTVDGSLVVNGIVTLSGTLAGSGAKTIAIGGTLNDAGSLAGTGEVTVASGGILNFSGSPTFSYEFSPTIRNHGATNWLDGSINFYCAGGQFINEADGMLTFGGSSSPRYWAKSNLTNLGIIDKNTSASLGFQNIGGCGGGPFSFDNSGVLNISAGQLTIESHNGTHSGTFNNAGTLTFGGIQALTTSGNVTGAGNFNITGTTTINIPYSFACTSVNLTGTLNGTGSKTIPSGCTLNDAGTIGGTGEVIVASGGTLELNGNAGTSEFSPTIRNHGTANWNNGSINYYCAGGQFINEADGTLIFGGSSSPRYWAKSNLTNLGTISKNTSAAIGFQNIGGCGGGPFSFDNSGVLNISAGQLTIESHNGTHSGTFNNAGTLIFGGIQTLATSGNVTGAGNFNITGTTTINVLYSFACTSVNLNGTLNGNGIKTIPSGCTLNDAGTIAGTGEVTVASGGTLNFSGNPTGSYQLAADIHNFGTTNWLDHSINYFCAGSGGNFINEASGLLVFGGGGTRYWGASNLTNFGTISKNTPAALLFQNISGCGGGPFSFDNHGLLATTAGTLQIDYPFTNDGALAGNGTINFGSSFAQTGSISPGNSPGILTLNTLPAGTTTTFIELQGSTTPGTDYDQIAITGAGTISGTLIISFLNNYEPTIGDEFIIMTCSGGCSGSFNNIVYPGNNPNAWQIDMTNPNEVKLILAQSLPVELVSLTARALNENTAQLKWQTASELNNKGFVIEKSTDGQRFKDIGFVKGAGTSHQMKTYHYQDEALRQDAYYRLRQVDFDGKASLSHIVFVQYEGKAGTGISVYPNPTSAVLTVVLTPKEVSSLLEIKNSIGILMQREVIAPETERHTVDITNLPSGIYFVCAQNELPVQFVKQ